MSSILVIDDEPSLRFSLKRTLDSDDISVATAETARAGIDYILSNRPDLVLLDVRLPDMSGLDALREIRALDQKLPVVVITAHGTTDTAIEATKRGAFDYLLKPFDLAALRKVVAQGLEAGRIARRPAVLEGERTANFGADCIIGRSGVMQDVFKAIGRVASSDVSVLVLGESGVGKELIARAIYQHSRRSERPFMAINCAAIPEALLESELFGHEKGSFTGADRLRIGRFEQATGGTIFLDEIGDMSPATQAKVLRLLQDQRFERVGGQETLQTDVRVIAATNQNLVELVAAGRFRQDLFFRLNTYTIPIPPLRFRHEDLPLLVDHFIHLHAQEIGKHVTVAAPETLQLMSRYPWPGNVRELQGTIKTALVNATSDVLTPECLPAAVRHDAAEESGSVPHELDHIHLAAMVEHLLETERMDIYRLIQFAVDRVVLNQVLSRVGGNQVEASRILGISRTTLRAKLAALNQQTEGAE